MNDPLLDKPLPQNLDAERAILGSILLDKSLCGQATALLKRSDLFLESHQALLAAMDGLNRQNAPIDTVTLPDAMGRALFEQYGGATWISSLINHGVLGANIPYYAKQITEKAARRRFIAECNHAMRTAWDDEEDVGVLREKHVLRVNDIQANGVKPRFEFLHWREIDHLPEPESLPDTHIISGGFNMWYGLSGTAKSFKALNDGYYLSRLGRGAVVYVSPEGKGAWPVRRKAWSEYTGLDPGDMYFYPGAVNLLNDGEVSVFIANMKAKFPGGVLLVVFDTKSRMMPGGEENSVKDDGIQVANSDRIKDTLGCAILLIHHSDKKDLSARGSGATTNACDCILKFTRSGDVITTSVTWPEGKLKDGEPWLDESFRFVSSEGSVVLESTDNVTTEFSPVTPKHIEILKAIEANGDAGAGYKRIATLTGIPERSVYRYIEEELLKARPPLVSSFNLPKGRGKRFLLTLVGRQLLPKSPEPSPTDKPNGHGELVDSSASSPTGCQPFASDPPPFAATLSSKESGGVANSEVANCERQPSAGIDERLW